ncbi:hypothetical protein BABINDRAFT_163856 [Babjeviella inositovora NRRL Y-12698]|uniref:Ubiquitin thioesterase OTU n=1 Tax=Babjeviella inositovora NRRL Y-12698 TaxID=984486 RepID=A0A1E3QHF8_9ASCO|nr:uncharacterized protein BABINDRAFT_163856 [Babjeviella inositovora NRRL Y-12698]ODQ77129.1 hypothetical protein BABINDRAFT_163856 [Babjeviella inositovora NRRL Y-12698]
MKLKFRSSTTSKVLTLPPHGTIKDLLQELLQAGLEPTQNDKSLIIKGGFPPKRIDISDSLVLLEEVGVKNGDQLVIEYGSTTSTSQSLASAKPPINAVSKLQPKQEPKPSRSISSKNSQKSASKAPAPKYFTQCLDGYIVLRVQPDDNSCLFNSVLYSLYGSTSQVYSALDLRRYVASYITSHADTYSEAILGKPNKEYAEWILLPVSWGGAIELQILSEFLHVKIQTIDVETGHIYDFSSELGDEDTSIAIVYSGIHYDSLVYSLLLTDLSKDIGVISLNTEWGQLFMAVASLTICLDLKDKGYATNTNKFQLLCQICGVKVKGQLEAAKHGRATGHSEFGEV